MRMKTLRRTVAITLCLVAATSCFSGKKPEPERNCLHAGVMVTCPQSIQGLQDRATCVSKGKKINFTNGIVVDSGGKTTLSKVRVNITEISDGFFSAELTAPDGTKGFVKAVRCK